MGIIKLFPNKTYNSSMDKVKNASLSKILYLTLSVPKKLKNSVFEMSIISQTLNINNFGTTNEKSYQPAYQQKACRIGNIKAIFTLTVFEILLFEGRSVLSLAQRSTGSEKNLENSPHEFLFPRKEIVVIAENFPSFPFEKRF